MIGMYEKKNKLHIVSVTAVIRRDGKYLVLRRRPDEVAYPGMYAFPGGKIEDNDTVEETLVKEVKEETSLRLKPGKILLKDRTFVRPDGQTVKVFSYLCEAEGSVKISNDFTDYKWITIEDLRNIEHVGIEEGIRKAEQLLALGSIDLLKTKSEKAVD